MQELTTLPIIGTLIGDVCGSTYEFDQGPRTPDLDLFPSGSTVTDDSILALGIRRAMLRCSATTPRYEVQNIAAEELQRVGREFPNPKGSYGTMFSQWVKAENPKPYGSWGNGALARTSPLIVPAVGTAWVYRRQAQAMTAATHNDSVALYTQNLYVNACFALQQGTSKETVAAILSDEISRAYSDPFIVELAGLRETNRHHEAADYTLKLAFNAFFEATDFESTLRNALSLGGDTDTVAAIACTLAMQTYEVPKDLAQQAWELAPGCFRKEVEKVY